MAAARTSTCPCEEQIADFSHGKLEATVAETIAAHLATCIDCRSAVQDIAADSFIERLRIAHGQDGTTAPIEFQNESVSRMNSATIGFQSASREGSGQLAIPTELADHLDYELLKELGRGGMGIVYLARNRVMDRLEVLKVVNKSLVEQLGARERFQREIRAAAKLSHPNIVAAHSVPRAGDLLILAMEYVDGQDLSQLVKEHGELPVTNAAYYAYQAALGLQHAHEHGLVHRDIKPNNLIVSVQGKRHLVKILDFGLAKATSEKIPQSDLTGSGQMLGTPDYVAPEQSLDAQKADIRADIYSLGCTMYYMLTGKPPFEGTGLYALLSAHHSSQARSLSELRPEVPAGLAAVVAKMMAKAPCDRYQTPAELAKALGLFFRAGENSLIALELVNELQVRVPMRREANSPTEAPTSPSVFSASEPPRADATKQLHHSSHRRWLTPAVMMVGLSLVSGIVAFGVLLLKVRTPDGVLLIEVNESSPEVSIDGHKARVRWDAGGKQAEISLPPGTRKVQIFKDGFNVIGEEVAIVQNGHTVLVAKLEPLDANDAHATVNDVARAVIDRLARAAINKTEAQPEFTADGDVYEARSATPGLLIGFDVSVSEWIESNPVKVVEAVRPIFQTASGVVDGSWHGRDRRGKTERIIAKAGYAVGAIAMQTGNTIDALQITFYRLREDGLDDRDSYSSDVVSELTKALNPSIDSGGLPIVGIHGTSVVNSLWGDVLTLGLLVADVRSTNTRASPLPALVPVGATQ